jgi:hypothetical protein
MDGVSLIDAELKARIFALSFAANTFNVMTLCKASICFQHNFVTRYYIRSVESHEQIGDRCAPRKFSNGV